MPLYHKFVAVILFWVRVPVLSEQIQLVDPRVSTASSFLHNTFLYDNFLAVNVKPTVTSASRPYGTLATIIPMANMKLVMAGYPIANPRQNRTIPHTEANIVIPKINRLIYFDNGDSSPFAWEANVAICPMNVLSPVNITNPLPDPYLFKVEKKAIFFVYNGFYLSVH